MRRSARLAEKQVRDQNEAQMEPIAKKKRSYNKIPNIANKMDNGTMVETFKYLNYCQLAKNSLVSKRFRDLIRTHRHKLALLNVHSIDMSFSPIARATVKFFDEHLTPEAYNEWTIRNSYSKLAPLQDQIVSTQCVQNIPDVYWFYAYAHYKDPNHLELRDITNVFFARAKLNDDNWPLFQHFVRLLTDPFIYVERVHLAYQIDVLNSLARANISDNGRLQCQELIFNLNADSRKFITWAKGHVRCNRFSVYGEADLNQDEVLLDFFLTGAHCTPEVKVSSNDLSKVMVRFVQKFLNLASSDESQLIESIAGNFKSEAIKLFKRDYAEFHVKEERNRRSTTHIFEFINVDIVKKMQLTAETYESVMSVFSIKINNL
ncbi:hypothetical protein DdX_18245 [Ditylenchus destructor]|uniref:F-box domain-containing protein n=1 Tax=Ditylenchus destructor TaxID=166010 RepID=A0AAD4MLX7_9BILA|nr:hypothetical protein DdX_18245 [Ditylenchus destructor]